MKKIDSIIEVIYTLMILTIGIMAGLLLAVSHDCKDRCIKQIETQIINAARSKIPFAIMGTSLHCTPRRDGSVVVRVAH